jgi:cytochrome c6
MKSASFFTGLTGALLFALQACGVSDSNAMAPASAKPDGKAIFKQYCVTCHGADGKLGLNGAKDLTRSVLKLEARIDLITNGKNMMTPYGEVLTPEEIRAVAKYTMERWAVDDGR